MVLLSQASLTKVLLLSTALLHLSAGPGDAGGQWEPPAATAAPLIVGLGLVYLHVTSLISSLETAMQ